MNSLTPFFSIIIPTYNRKEKLLKALSSIREQTFIDYEVVIVDDGSTDGTEAEIKKIADARINYFYQENSGLPAKARNKGIELSKGKWLCFLDSDDWWTNDKLQVVSDSILAHPDYEFFSHHEFQVDGSGKITRKLFHRPKSNQSLFVDLMTKGNHLSPSAAIISSKLMKEVGLFDVSKELYSVEDYDLWLKLAERTKCFYINEFLGYYLVDGQGISSNLNRHFDAYLYCLEKHISKLSKRYQNSAWAHYHYALARGYSSPASYSLASKHFLQSIKKEFNLKCCCFFIIAKIKSFYLG